jgi:DNA-binding transcriptional LysR family regulator
MTPKLTLRQLHYFEVVAGERTLRGAAQRLNIAQPALSRQIRDLEKKFGSALFIRQAHGVELTMQGRELLTCVTDFMTHYGQLESHFCREPAIEGLLRIGFDSAVAQSGRFAAAISSTKSRHPSIHLVLKEVSERRQVELLARRELDVTFAYETFEALAHSPSLESICLQTEKLKLIVAATHPLAKQKKVLPSELYRSPYVFVSRDKACDSTYIEFTRQLKNLGMELQIIQEVDNVPALLALVSVGIGVSLVPDRMVADFCARVVVKDLEGLDADARLIAMWNPHNDSVALRFFIHILRQCSEKSK